MKVTDTIAQSAPGLRFKRYRKEIGSAIQATLDDGQFIGGIFVEAFEKELAGFLGTDHVIGCNSGTDALYLSLCALGISEGHQVIVPSLTAAGSAVAVLRSGATPQFSDVNLKTRNIDLPSIERVMTSKVKAIIVVHLHGAPADLDPILDFARHHNLSVIEDCAQATGATYRGVAVGTLGDAGAFSFYPTKNLGAMGDGGAVVTNNASVAGIARSMRNYGWDSTRMCVRNGINSRLDSVQAAILSALLPMLPTGNMERIDAAHSYFDALNGSRITLPTADLGHVYHQFSVETEDRIGFMDHLAKCGIGTGIHYANGLHEEPYFQRFVADNAAFPHTNYLAQRLCSLPIQPELMRDQDRIIRALKGCPVL